MILAKFGPNRTIGSKVMGEKFNPAYFHQETYYTLGFAKFGSKVRRTSNPKFLAELSNPNPNLKTTSTNPSPDHDIFFKKEGVAL